MNHEPAVRHGPAQWAILAICTFSLAVSARTQDSATTRPAASQSTGRFQPAAERTPALAAFEQLKYGMFIHFGLSTFTQEEFGKKLAPASDFNPTQLDVEQWIRTAKEAGMRYAVLTAKHCTGHCLWPSRHTDFTVANSAVKTDVVGTFVKACRAQGLQPGLYYLLGWDTHHQPQMTPAEYETFASNQLAELLTDYGPLMILWLDIPFDLGPDTQGALQRIYDRIKSIQPDCLVLLNQGFENGVQPRSGPPTYFYKAAGTQPVLSWPTDVIDGEITLPPAAGHAAHMTVQGRKYYVPMEVCDVLTENWFWVEGSPLRSLPMLYRLYQATTQRNANLLLDVPPDRSGRIPAEFVARLRELKQAIDDPQRIPPSVALRARTSASNVYRNDAQYGPELALDGDVKTRWATDDDRKEAWLRVDLAAPAKFNAAYLREGWQRVRKFDLQQLAADGEWRNFYSGTTIGDSGILVRFPAVTAQSVRLSIGAATTGPTIWDFELLHLPD